MVNRRSTKSIRGGILCRVIFLTGLPHPETDAAASGIARRPHKAGGPCARVCITSRRARFAVWTLLLLRTSISVRAGRIFRSQTRAVLFR
jgi:hypothetical protein